MKCTVVKLITVYSSEHNKIKRQNKENKQHIDVNKQNKKEKKRKDFKSCNIQKKKVQTKD